MDKSKILKTLAMKDFAGGTTPKSLNRACNCEFEGDSIPEGEGHKRAAFTLAETMIVLVVLGVVASITIPAVVRNQIDAQNRTKLKKMHDRL